MVNWWFGARWFGIRIRHLLSNNPFHKGILSQSKAPGAQTTNLPLSWYLSSPTSYININITTFRLPSLWKGRSSFDHLLITWSSTQIWPPKIGTLKTWTSSSLQSPSSPDHGITESRGSSGNPLRLMTIGKEGLMTSKENKKTTVCFPALKKIMAPPGIYQKDFFRRFYGGLGGCLPQTLTTKCNFSVCFVPQPAVFHDSVLVHIIYSLAEDVLAKSSVKFQSLKRFSQHSANCPAPSYQLCTVLRCHPPIVVVLPGKWVCFQIKEPI